MNCISDRPVMVFKKENKYSVGISKKKQDGEYEKAFFPIQFGKDVEIEDRTLIQIKNAWLSFYKWEYEEKKGTTFFIKCNDYEIVQDSKEMQPKKEEKDPFAEFGKITDNDLPF